MAVRHFACTQCGKCCDRSPEVLLSEAARLVDAFVFRLMFRLYRLPQQARAVFPTASGEAGSSEAFYERKRLLKAFAARKAPAKLWSTGSPIAATDYLMISALAVDTTPGRCGALHDNACGIYEQRPVACRSVPLHNSRPEASAEASLQAFLSAYGERCDTSETAPILLKEDRLVGPETKAARSASLEIAQRDRRWSDAIARRMGTKISETLLPSLREIEASMDMGALTVPMSIAWQIAAEVGIIPPRECNELLERQVLLISRELEQARCGPEARRTLIEMQQSYRRHPRTTLQAAVSN